MTDGQYGTTNKTSEIPAVHRVCRVPTEDEIAEAREEAARERYERSIAFRRLMQKYRDEYPRESEPEEEEEEEDE